jgi:membrane protein implicated in regulation of membrane protease activity
VALVWIIITAAGIAIDIFTSSILFVGFSVGGLAALISYYLEAPVLMQFIIFIGLSLISLSLIYPLITKGLKKNIPKTLPMENSYLGRKIVLAEDMEDKGTIKLDGIYWSVKNAGKPMSKGNSAVICGIEGNKLIIKKVEEE